jgi:hypothetical protein
MPRESKCITQRRPLSSSTHELNKPRTKKMLENVFFKKIKNKKRDLQSNVWLPRKLKSTIFSFLFPIFRTTKQIVTISQTQFTA